MYHITEGGGVSNPLRQSPGYVKHVMSVVEVSSPWDPQCMDCITVLETNE